MWQAQALREEISEQLTRATTVTAAPPLPDSDAPAAAGAPRPPALSRMKKADLVTECEERGLPPKGTVVEMRAMLRVERKRDTLCAAPVKLPKHGTPPHVAARVRTPLPPNMAGWES